MSEQIELRQTDSCFERARKLFSLTGVVDNRGLAILMAEAIDGYRKMDIAAGARSMLDDEEQTPEQEGGK